MDRYFGTSLLRRRRPLAVSEVESAFDQAAGSYDLMVRLNPGYHRHLRAAAAALAPLPPDRSVLIDLGCGSGASTRALLSGLAGADHFEIVGVDASAGMLDQARAKSWPGSVRFVRGRAEELADARSRWGVSTPVGGILAAYLFRNLEATDRGPVLEAAREALAPGGTLVAQEYSVAGSRRAQLVWWLVCWLVVIPLSRVTNKDTRLYRYLWRSVLRFDSVEQFSERLRAAGFCDVEVRPVGGWQRGILHTFRARRPDLGDQ